MMRMIFLAVPLEAFHSESWAKKALRIYEVIDTSILYPEYRASILLLGLEATTFLLN